MATVKPSQLPDTLQLKVIESTDTNAIDLVAASPGKIVRLWGGSLVGGTSILFSSDDTALSGIMETTGLQLALPRGNPADAAYPYYESEVGETIKVTPGGSGLSGVLYYTQD